MAAGKGRLTTKIDYLSEPDMLAVELATQAGQAWRFDNRMRQTA